MPSRSTAGAKASGRTAQPSRQPVIPKYLEKLLMTIASGSMLSALRGGVPSGAGSARSR
jgi:hypothetical protein